MSVPAIDSLIGIEVYSTSLLGIGGSIKNNPDDFFVEEILDERSIDLSRHPDPSHEFALYLLQKKGIDSNHALREAERATGLKLKIVGMKDAHATTTQYVSSMSKRIDVGDHIDTINCSLTLIGYTTKPLSKRNLYGNKFTVYIENWNLNTATITKLEDALKQNTIGNFYGYQRFGSARAVTHLVGKEILKNDFQKAVEILLCFPGRYDSKELRELREECRDKSKMKNVLGIMPVKMDLERMVVKELANDRSVKQALRRLPVNVRRLFVQAYQSYLFNRALSKIIEEGTDIAIAADQDVCFRWNNGISSIGRYDPSFEEKQIPAVPMPGYAFRDDNRFGSIMRGVMNEEGISRQNFYVKEMEEISVEGGFRQAPLTGEDFSYQAGKSLLVKFTLRKGCYATILLRELMKPVDPIQSGF